MLEEDNGERRPIRVSEDVLAIRRAVAAFVALILVVGAVAAYQTLSDRRTQESSPAALDGSARVPVNGEALGPYLASQEEAVRAAEGRHQAVVSLTSYRSAEVVRQLLRDNNLGLAIEQFIVAIPGGAPTVVDEPYADGLTTAVQPLLAERDEIAALLPTVDDPEFATFYQSEIVRLEASIAAVNESAEIVVGAVVTGGSDEMRRLNAQPETRVVVLDVDDDDVASAVLLPETTATVGQPIVRPLVD